jgi:hypothetical protein
MQHCWTSQQWHTIVNAYYTIFYIDVSELRFTTVVYDHFFAVLGRASMSGF